MILKITTKNNELLSLLNKNPNSDEGLYLTSYKDACIIGECVDSNNYRVLVHDDGESFGADNQMYHRWSSSPYIGVVVLNELFPHILKESNQYFSNRISWIDNKEVVEIDNQPVTITIDDVIIKNGWARNGDFLITRYLPGVTLSNTRGDVHTFTVTADSLFKAINISAIILMMLTVTDREVAMGIETSYAKKYIKILNNIPEVPYFIYYLFAKRVVGRFQDDASELMEIISDNLTKHLGEECALTQYDTHRDRMNYVSSNLDFTKPVLNIGCEEFQYEKKFFRLMEAPWVSYDIVDFTKHYEEMREFYHGASKHWLFVNDLDKVDKTLEYQVVISEVMEHTEPEVFKELLKKLFTEFKVSKFIITTPDKNFNKFYFFDDEEAVRREDHVRELTSSEFLTEITSLVNELTSDYTISQTQIGDKIGKASVTSAIILNHK